MQSSTECYRSALYGACRPLLDGTGLLGACPAERGRVIGIVERRPGRNRPPTALGQLPRRPAARPMLCGLLLIWGRVRLDPRVDERYTARFSRWEACGEPNIAVGQWILGDNPPPWRQPPRTQLPYGKYPRR